MARFSADTADNYGSHGGTGFFSLKNDKDVARVRFLYDSIEDVEGFAVHQVEIDGKKHYVDCKRDYTQTVDACPLCKRGIKQDAKMFIPLLDEATGQVKIWERGKKFFNQISQLCSRYAQNEPLCSHIFEIERSGKAGDQGTTYGIFEVGKDNKTLADLPEVPNILGSFVWDKSVEDMEYFINHGDFPDNVAVDEAPFRRGQSNEVERRTPSRGDRF